VTTTAAERDGAAAGLRFLTEHGWAIGGLVVLAILAVASGFSVGFPAEWDIGLGDTLDDAQRWVVGNRFSHPLFTVVFEPLTNGIAATLEVVNFALDRLTWAGVLLLGTALAWRTAGGRVAAVTAGGLALLGFMGMWEESMRTLALTLVALGISAAIGVPLGILAGRNTRFFEAIRPVLDSMQTLPAYVYLLPVVLVFRTGDPGALIATIIYAVPPAVRLTALGIRGVAHETLEVGASVGSTRRQILTKVQLPLALPSIRLGINQTIMMALAMVVFGSLVGGTGLGREVLRGLQTLDVGRAFDAGIGIVIIAIVLDRITGGVGARRDRNALAELPPRLQVAGTGLLLVAIAVLSGVVGDPAFPGQGPLSIASQTEAVDQWLRANLYAFTQPLSAALTSYALNPLRAALLATPWWVLTGLATIAAWRTVGGRMAAYTVAAFVAAGALGMWNQSLNTASQVALAVVISIGLAVPIGILASQNDALERGLRPVLDAMQTMPAFVYLIPVVALFGVGRVPGLIASVVYALPPAIRLTNAGIRQVPAETVEAAMSAGTTRWQLMRSVQLPLAKPSIMMGINQTTMMVLAGIIIAGLIGAGGLGIEAVRGLTRNEVGLGLEAGIAIVLLGIVLDRITQAFGREGGHRAASTT
jgi:glycine betaine/proline transport system permease protein